MRGGGDSADRTLCSGYFGKGGKCSQPVSGTPVHCTAEKDNLMTNVDLPTNVFTLIQGSYDVIPGSPWVYSIEGSILNIFKTLQPLEKTADIVLGMKTSDNFRFVRYWWEINDKNKNWVAYEKHVTGFPYYYPTHALVLWNTDSIAYFHDLLFCTITKRKNIGCDLVSIFHQSHQLGLQQNF